MKKIMLISITVTLLAALMVIPVSAKPSVIKGEVNEIKAGENTITVLTHRNQTVIVVTPVEFDLSKLAIGDEVLVKGQLQGDGSIAADWVKLVGAGGADDEDAPEGSKATNSAFCAGDKQQEPHPMASALAEKYGVTTEWVMGYFCNGYGMGAIMLALKTHEINGADADALLAQRASGMGWGAIWQELNIIGSERDVQTPPGLLNKPNHGNQ